MDASIYLKLKDTFKARLSFETKKFSFSNNSVNIKLHILSLECPYYDRNTGTNIYIPFKSKHNSLDIDHLV